MVYTRARVMHRTSGKSLLLVFKLAGAIARNTDFPARVTHTKAMRSCSSPTLLLLAPEETGKTVETLAELIAQHHAVVDGIGLLCLVDILLHHCVLWRWSDQCFPLAGNA